MIGNLLPSIFEVVGFFVFSGIIIVVTLFFPRHGERMPKNSPVTSAYLGRDSNVIMSADEEVGQGIIINATTLPFLIDEIKLSIANEQYTRAEDLCNQVRGTFPHNAYIVFLQYKALSADENPPKTEVVLKNLIALIENADGMTESITEEIPSQDELYYELGKVMEKQDKNEPIEGKFMQSSLEAFYECIKLNPRNAKGYYALAEVMMKNDYSLEDYLPYYEQAFRHDSSLIDVGLKLGNTFYLLGDFLKSGLAFNKIIQFADENNAEAYYGLGLVAMKQNQLSKARSFFEKALLLGYENDSLEGLLGQVLFVLEEFEQAEHHLSVACDLSPTALRYYKLALCQEKLQKYENACETMKKGVGMENENKMYWEYYFHLLSYTTRTDELVLAKKMIEQLEKEDEKGLLEDTQ